MKLDIYDSGTKNQKHNVPLVFVHGAWCGKWIWMANFVPFFEEKGYRCVAMDLRGHGGSEGKENLRKYTSSDYEEDARSVIKSVGGNAILMGHSMGGGIIEKMITKQPVAAAVLIGPIPPHGAKQFSDRLMKNYRGTMMKVALTKNMKSIVEDPQRAKLMFFGKEVPEAAFKICQSNLGNESYTCAREIEKPLVTGNPNPYNVPILLIGASQDWVFGPDEIKKAGEVYGVQPIFYDDGHALQMENCWKEVATDIDKWIVSKGF